MPAAPRDWALPFLEQARADLRVAWTVPPEYRGSTFCMLLQMVFEKLAKAAYARSGQVVPHTHRAASHLFAVFLRRPGGLALLQGSQNVQQFVVELETAHPQLARALPQPCPQLEYPWEDPVNGIVYHPERDLAVCSRVRNPRDRIALDCLRLASAIEQQLFTIIP
ncbi:hypothetical protein [Sorangium cellulosum]|uniref:hypothetical protein n=1 Tax=Sorangium cellulosum TaxID=56 RepID=UPI0013316067|nr:hypothetical protein [Sorangium cellulosum]